MTNRPHLKRSPRFSGTAAIKPGPCVPLKKRFDLIAEWQPNIALLDVNLPDMNGVDLAIALRSSHPNCRVLLFSGYPAANDLLEEAMQAGHVFEIISKPLHPTLLLDAVAKSLSDTPDQPQAAVAGIS